MQGGAAEHGGGRARGFLPSMRRGPYLVPSAPGTSTVSGAPGVARVVPVRVFRGSWAWPAFRPVSYAVPSSAKRQYPRPHRDQ